MSEKCSICRFWDVAGSPSPVHHRCLRYPPVHIYDGEESATQWPWTSPNDWCGEFVIAVRKELL